MENDWKKRLGVVYSTNPEFSYNKEDKDSNKTILPQGQDLRIRPEKKGRNGKTVSVISGFAGDSDDLQELARKIKTKCGTGGTVKEGEIIIQGDFVDKIIVFLKDLNYKIKRSGG